MNDYSWFMKNYHKTEEYLLNQIIENGHDPYQLHHTYNKIINLYYKFREEYLDALDKCLKYCWFDIELYPLYEQSYKNKPFYSGIMPTIPSFKRAVQILERKEDFQQAIHICVLAIAYEIDDGTKGGFHARLKKLKNKI